MARHSTVVDNDAEFIENPTRFSKIVKTKYFIEF